MEEAPSLTRRRLARLVDDLQARVVVASVPLEVSARHLGGEPVPYAEAVAGEFEPFAVGDRWGPAWDTTWFRLRGAVPEEWSGRPVDVRVGLGFRDYGWGGAGGFGAEALAWCAGEPVAAFTGRHGSVRLTGAAEGGEAVDWYLEAAANPLVAALLSQGRGAPWTAVDAGGEPLFRLERADLALVDPGAEARWLDALVALDLAGSLEPGSPRHAELEAALRALADRGDGARLAAALARPSTLAHTVWASGHAHIDTAWLWPLREARRKVARTWATAVRLAAEDPGYRFCASAAQHWEWVREDHPGLFRQLRLLVDRGQVEPVGAMWVEPDCNLPSGEALVRQIAVGWRWFRDNLGVEPDGIFLPDVFGYPAQLPQLARLAGLRWLCTQKMSWSRVNRFPHRTFWWEGLDGSRLLTHFPPADTYNAEVTAAQLLAHVHGFPHHDWATGSLLLYGYGDGGGGPTRELLARARRVADLDGLPPVRREGVSAFFAAARREADAGGDAVPVWVGELYLEMHRGTYTTQAATKAGNRQAQEGLREVELWWALRAADEGFGRWPAEGLDGAWREALTQQFHDILPGSSIGWVHADAESAHRRVRSFVEREVSEALAGDEPAPVVVNPTGRWRAGLVEGRWVTAPPFSSIPLADAEQPPPAEVRSGDGWATNGAVRVEWATGTGLLTSVRDLSADREVLAGPANVLQLFDDRPVEYDAWDVDAHSLAHPVPWTEAEAVRTEPDGFTVERRSPSGRSRVVQRIRLHPGNRRIDVETEVDWHEDHVLLKAAFPLAVRSSRATYEVQYGAVERPTHRNTSWDAARFEVPAQRWADLSEAGYGAAVLNDAKHGYDCHGNVLRLTLLRSPTAPDPTADRGRHRFTYALYPHPGSWQEGGVVEAAEDLNRPLRIVPAGRVVRPRLWLDAPGAVIDCVKRAFDRDAWVVRLYEPWGGRFTGHLVTDLPVSEARHVDLLERDLGDAGYDEGAVPLTLGPFEVVTLLLT